MPGRGNAWCRAARTAANKITYGAANSTYLTEIDSFLTVSAKDGSAGHPDYFEVVRKDGSTATYGAKGKSSAEHKVYKLDGTQSEAILTWALQEIKDSAGNRIVYTYTDDKDGHRIAAIRYAHGDPKKLANSARAEVSFSYAARDDATRGYLAGYELQSTQRLTRITVRAMGTGAKTQSPLPVLRTYRLRYENKPANVLSPPAGGKGVRGDEHDDVPA